MCELLVWVCDKEAGGDPRHDAVRFRRGDVICAVPDGHLWSPAERSNPAWVVLCVPDLTLAEGLALTVPEPEEPHRRVFHTRLFGLDLDVHPQVRGAAAVELEAAAVRGSKRKKPPAQDPDVLGRETVPSDVLG